MVFCVWQLLVVQCSRGSVANFQDIGLDFSTIGYRILDHLVMNGSVSLCPLSESSCKVKQIRL